METPESREVVLPFPSSRNVPMLARKVPPRLGHGSPRIQLVAPADPAGDAAINSEWDLLIRLATEAWVWHSPRVSRSLSRRWCVSARGSPAN